MSRNRNKSDIRTRRVYDEPSNSDGLRVLVDRLWPRGLSREKAELDDWIKDVAPSDALRRWFGHDPEKWDEFQHRYAGELDDRPDAVEQIRQKTREGRVTLLYGAKAKRYNNAVALKRYLESMDA